MLKSLHQILPKVLSQTGEGRESSSSWVTEACLEMVLEWCDSLH